MCAVPAAPKPEPRPRKRLAPGRTLAAPTEKMRPFSAKRAVENQVRADLRPHWFRREGVCEAQKYDRRGPGSDCLGGLTIHEAYTRARSGGIIDDPRSWFTLCAEHNRLVSQDAAWMVWAEEVGLLFHDLAGREWLEAGGRFPGLSKQQTIEEVMTW